MKVSELIEKDFIDVIVPGTEYDIDISGCISGDLLSHVMSHAEKDNAWITVLGHINIIAVAFRCSIACVIIADGMELDDDAKKAAFEHGICVLGSKKSVCELSAIIYSYIKK